MTRWLAPNIDARGRLMRAGSGLLLAALGVWVALHPLHVGGPALRWTLVVLGLAVGGFQLFEAACGWCVLRALGIRTRI